MQSQITLKLLFFGLCRELVGSGRLELTVADPSTVSDVLSEIKKQYPNLARPHLLNAVNEKYVDDRTILQDGDEVAIFTAVSGG